MVLVAAGSSGLVAYFCQPSFMVLAPVPKLTSRATTQYFCRRSLLCREDATAHTNRRALLLLPGLWL